MSSIKKGMHLSIIKLDQYEDALDFIENQYYPDETLCVLFGVKPNQCYRHYSRQRLQQNLSVILTRKNTGEILGVHIASVIKKVAPFFPVVKNESTKKMFDFCFQKDEKIQFFEIYDVEEAVRLGALAVNRSFRHQRIGYGLVLAVLELAKDLGHKAAAIEASSKFTQQICEKIGFDILDEIRYDQHFPADKLNDLTKFHTKYVLYGKKL